MFLKSVAFVLVAFGFVAALSGTSAGQTRFAVPPSHVRASAAYSEILLRQTELEAEAESLLMEFTEDYPKVKNVRIELDFLKAESARLFTVKPGDSAKLTLALGKLILGKVSHAAALKGLQMQYQDGHPTVKKEKRMVEIFEAAIKEILD
jgi:hypothetical protein